MKTQIAFAALFVTLFSAPAIAGRPLTSFTGEYRLSRVSVGVCPGAVSVEITTLDYPERRALTLIGDDGYALSANFEVPVHPACGCPSSRHGNVFETSSIPFPERGDESCDEIADFSRGTAVHYMRRCENPASSLDCVFHRTRDCP